MWALLTLFLACVSAQDPLICPAFACAPPGYELSTNVCIEQHSSGFWLSLCPGFNDVFGCVFNDQPGQSSKCDVLPLPEVELSYPGEPCKTEENCIGNNTAVCVFEMCQGLGTEKMCSQDYDCDVGLFCDITGEEGSGVCVYQLSEGDSCLREFECLNTLGCTGFKNSTASYPGTCIPYYSLENGQRVHNCEMNDGEGYSRLCMSGACLADNAETGGAGTCIAGFTSAAPVKCKYDSDCIGTSKSGAKAQKTCQCGYSSSGQGYCPLFSGDSITQEVLIFSQMLLQTNMSDCHTSHRFSDFCFGRYFDDTDFSSYKQTVEVVTNFFLYQQNDNCVRANLLNDFYELSAESLECPAYSCSTLLSNNLCAVFNQGNNTYELATCSAGNMCPVSNLGLSNVTCTAPVIQNGIAFPGEPCVTSAQCNTNQCSEGVCQGVQSGGTCANSTVCNVGLYCTVDLKCEALVGTGNDCLSESDCQLNAGCNILPTNSTCVSYFSLTNNEQVYCPVSGFQPLCASSWCQTLHANMVGTCVAAPVSAGGLPMTCQADDQCVDTTHTYTSKCTCGFNPTGQKYCALFPGDTPFATYLNNTKTILSETNAATGPCQTTRRFTAECVNQTIAQSNSGTYEMLSQYYIATMYPQLQNNDACVQSIFTSQYWSIPTPQPTPSGNAVIAGVAAGLLWLSVLG